jgi:glycine/D-amino acid oxidase-like deaminating enzyme
MGGRGPMRLITAPQDVSYLIDYAKHLWPELAGQRWTHGWNSRLAVTQDHWPHLHEPAENALIYLGCNGRGIALGTAIAEQLAARLLMGSQAQLDQPVVSLRPIRFHRLWPLAVRSVVLHGRIMDRMGL